MGRSNADEKKKAGETTDKFIEQTKKQFPSETVFNAQVKATGMNMDQFRTRALEQNICELVLDRELKSKITISDDKVKKFYDENPKEFEQPERVRVSHILIMTQDKNSGAPMPAAKKKEKEKQIRDIKARAEKGEDFAKLAKEFSEDPGSKDNGGEYTFARAKDDPRRAMVPEFEAAAFSLKTNQISDVVETQYGYHIIKLLEKLAPKKEEFSKVTSNIKDYLVNKEFEKQLPDFLDKVKKEAGVEIIAPKDKAK
jgi:parvulin-like peptidyl-prolyl isomerase